MVVHGALGKMGKEVLSAVCADPEIEPVGAIEQQPDKQEISLPDDSKTIPITSDIDSLLKTHHPDVMVDFTVVEASMSAIRIAALHNVNLVIGTTGFTEDNLSEIEELSREHNIGIVIASNFAMGAIVMTHLAKVASKFFDWAEIIEMHHEGKVDAPSGTAITTAEAMIEAHGKPFDYQTAQKESVAGTRGGEIEGVAIHSMRLPGLLAHQEIIMGMAGQTLRIRHDTINRQCYMPGVLLAIKEVVHLKGLNRGLDSLLHL
ncbi:MAG: 4-hydroxy-tetrahydrodipicolinate reductase [Chloroflexota bacterium]|nr:4-hydroxy-tetrahydrodipicolinate reductase [Chloroflexota bacterium]